jgi:hypothetical protein
VAYVWVDQTVVRHRKTWHLARLAGLDAYAVVGRLVALWGWSLDGAPEGRIDAGDAVLVADVMGWRGDPEQWLAYLVQAGFLDERDGGLFIHDWDEYAGKLMASRKANTEHKRASRERARHAGVLGTSGGREVDVHGMSGGRQADVTGTSAAGQGTPYPSVAKRNVSILHPDQESPEGVSGEESAPAASDARGDKPKKSAKLRPLFGDEDPAMVLAHRLSERIRAHKPDANVGKTTAQLQKWAAEIDVMLRVDKRAPPEVEAIIDWSQAEPFWASVILSPASLRKGFDRLQMQGDRDARGTTGRRATSYGSRPGEPEMYSDEYYAAFKQRLALRESGAGPEPEGGGTAA